MIEVDNRQNKFEITQDLINLIEKTIDESLKFEKFNLNYEISVVLTDNEEIRQINKLYRGIDRDTDVLSFPMLEYDEGYEEDGDIEVDFEDLNPETGGVVLGDIVVSLEKARQQAEEYGHSFERELSFLIVHSVLHLLGYDHENDSDRAIMREKEENILSNLGQTR
ncbi:MAG: rRNA maturation RNase YbeY [Clostridiales bacterium]|nr:rRNA maturation RNase YbeY [Clostridiales bacterium]